MVMFFDAWHHMDRRQTAETPVPLHAEIAAGRAVIDRQTVHVHDVRAADDQGVLEIGAAFGIGESRTLLAVPLLREGVSIGAILIRRFQVQPFLDSQIALLKTFADQAVIAIENVRLFQELQVRNRDLTEALEQQTATSEVLQRHCQLADRSSRRFCRPCAQNAARLCEAKTAPVFRIDGEILSRCAANYGEVAGWRYSGRFCRGTVSGRAVVRATGRSTLTILSESGDTRVPATARAPAANAVSDAIAARRRRLSA